MQFKASLGLFAVLIPALSGCSGGGQGSFSTQHAVNGMAATARISSYAGRCIGGLLTSGVPGVIAVAGAPGVSPTTSVAVNGTTVTTTVDYGTGITSGSNTVSGSFVGDSDTATNTGTITFNNLTVAAPTGTTATSGTIQFTITPPSTPGQSTVQAADDLTVTQNGSVDHLTGNETALASKTQGLQLITTAAVTLTAPEGRFTSDAKSLTLDSATHRVNGGTVHSTYHPASSSLTVDVNLQFTSETPTTGLVIASFNKAPTVRLHVPTSDL